MTVFEEILTWSQDQPEWQRDALLHLVIAGQLQLTDDNQLAMLCKQRHGLAGTDAAVMQLLSAEHLKGGSTERTVVLSLA